MAIDVISCWLKREAANAMPTTQPIAFGQFGPGSERRSAAGRGPATVCCGSVDLLRRNEKRHRATEAEDGSTANAAKKRTLETRLVSGSFNPKTSDNRLAFPGAATWSDLKRIYDDRKLIELVILAGQYKTVTYYQDSPRLPLSEGNEGLMAR